MCRGWEDKLGALAEAFKDAGRVLDVLGSKVSKGFIVTRHRSADKDKPQQDQKAGGKEGKGKKKGKDKGNDKGKDKDKETKEEKDEKTETKQKQSAEQTD